MRIDTPTQLWKNQPGLSFECKNNGQSYRKGQYIGILSSGTDGGPELYIGKQDTFGNWYWEALPFSKPCDQDWRQIVCAILKERNDEFCHLVEPTKATQEGG